MLRRQRSHKRAKSIYGQPGCALNRLRPNWILLPSPCTRKLRSAQRSETQQSWPGHLAQKEHPLPPFPCVVFIQTEWCTKTCPSFSLSALRRYESTISAPTSLLRHLNPLSHRSHPRPARATSHGRVAQPSKLRCLKAPQSPTKDATSTAGTGGTGGTAHLAFLRSLSLFLQLTHDCEGAGSYRYLTGRGLRFAQKTNTYIFRHV